MIFPCRIIETTKGIHSVDRLIPAVCIGIRAQQPLTGACIPVRTDKPCYLGIVVSGLEVVEAGFFVIEVAAVAEGVGLAEGGGHGAGAGEDVAYLNSSIAVGDLIVNRLITPENSSKTENSALEKAELQPVYLHISKHFY